ncbi:lysine N(6)-hydroxylase/L-ornithine N(5)-oxygenase family protein [Sphingomonas sp. NCPPB 2930]
MSSAPVYDFIGIGLGPFNLGLACLSEPVPGLRSLFLEQKDDFCWHGGMLLDGTTLQNPFLADLVSMADPTSHFSYLNYCKQQGRLHTYYIRENFYLSRQEYDRYCKWAAAGLSNVHFQHRVLDIRHDAAEGCYRVSGRQGRDGQPFCYRCLRLVLGIGSVPQVPGACDGSALDHHTAHYLARKPQLQTKRSITVIGSGQSGAEVYFDLLQDCERFGYALNWVTRSPRFFQMENAKLTLELISPDYIDHFYRLPEPVKRRVLEDQRSIYNGINQTLIDRIYDLLDETRDRPGVRTQLLTNLALDSHRYDPAARRHALRFCHTELGHHYTHETEGLVLATGYRACVPSFVEGIRDRIRWRAPGRYAQARNYAVDLQAREIFVQNAGLYSHGLTNPDLGLACCRNARLIRELTGVDHYAVETRTTFQDFAPRPGSSFVRCVPAPTAAPVAEVAP